jgi:hypothetical protein
MKKRSEVQPDVFVIGMCRVDATHVNNRIANSNVSRRQPESRGHFIFRYDLVNGF